MRSFTFNLFNCISAELRRTVSICVASIWHFSHGKILNGIRLSFNQLANFCSILNEFVLLKEISVHLRRILSNMCVFLTKLCFKRFLYLIKSKSYFKNEKGFTSEIRTLDKSTFDIFTDNISLQPQAVNIFHPQINHQKNTRLI